MIKKVIKLKSGDCVDQKIVIIAFEVEVFDENLSRGLETPEYMFIARKTQNLSVLEMTSIEKKCIWMPFLEDKILVVPLVNTMETD